MREKIAIAIVLFVACCTIILLEKRIEAIESDRDSYKATAYSLILEIDSLKDQK